MWPDVDPAIPPDSPRGQLDLALAATISDPDLALDRLSAVEDLRRLLDEVEAQAVLGARLAGCSWVQLGRAIGADRRRAVARWREQVRPYEVAGLLSPDPLPPPATPVDPDAATDLRDARAWCRWCGHRLVHVGPDLRWAHNSTDGPPGDLIDVDCPGSEPWPAEED